MTPNVCAVCGTDTNLRCSSCKSVYYCSREHIRQHWPSHKGDCKRITSQAAAPAAGTNTFDAILFPENETTPRLVKLPWKWGSQEPDDEYPISWHDLDNDEWFKRQPRFRRMYDIRTLGMRGPALPHALGIIFDDNALINRSPVNLCIRAITGGKAVHPWSGNILAIRTKGTDLYEDVDMERDMTPLIRYFEDYGRVMPR